MQGKPVIRGTRIPVELLLRKLAEGAMTEDLLDAYPRLVADDIRAALAYAAEEFVGIFELGWCLSLRQAADRSSLQWWCKLAGIRFFS